MTTLPTTFLRDSLDEPTSESSENWQEEFANSAYWYGPVGLIIGVLLFASAIVSSFAGAFAPAAVVLCVWVFATGGLHLDGVADCADAIGAHASEEKQLDILRDPHVGAMAVTTIVVVLVTKFGLLVSIFQSVALDRAGYSLLLAAPIIARMLVGLTLRSPKHALSLQPSSTLGALANGGEPNPFGTLDTTVLIFGGFCVWLSTGIVTVLALIMPAVIGYQFMLWAGRRLGGLSGDVFGATIEFSECAVLLTLALLTSAP